MRKTRKFAEGGDSGTTDYASSGSAGGTNISFGEAFRAARKQGLDKFTWKGKSFTTELDKPKAPKATESSKKPEPAKVAESAKAAEPTKKPEAPKSTGSSRGYTRTARPKAEQDAEYARNRRESYLSRINPLSSDLFGLRREERTMKSMGVDRKEARERIGRLKKSEKASGMKSGGSVRGKGCEVKGTGKGRMR